MSMLIKDEPWENEPDRLEFVHEGYQCLIRRIPVIGALCGYVAVPREHPYYAIDKDVLSIKIHGGLTYSSRSELDICSKEMPDADVWWFGFDCAHYTDFYPGIGYRKWTSVYEMAEIGASFIGEYRNFEYVIDQTKSLAEQLNQLTPKPEENPDENDSINT